MRDRNPDMENLLADLRHAFRVFLKSPGFTAIAIAALALGIGANTAIFSVINVVLLKPLPYPEARTGSCRLLAVSRAALATPVSIPKFNAWKKNDVFEAMTAYDFAGPGMNVGGSDHPEQVKGIHVSSEFFRVFGVSPVLGRTFTADEDLPGGPKVAVISYQLFSRRLGGDLRLVGTPLQIGWRTHHRDRSSARHLQVRSAGGYLHSVAGRSEQHQPGPLPAGRRTPEARRHVAGRQGANEDRRRTVPPSQPEVDGQNRERCGGRRCRKSRRAT